MSSILKPKSAVIFMKVGLHAQETLEDIIKRKQDEFAKTGVIFWGYGGNTCHPTSLVQPFAKKHAELGQTVHLIMNPMNSRHYAQPELAKEYSEDGIDWYPVPSGIEVRGSRFGMVIGGLTEEAFDFNLRQATVAVGPSQGVNGADYIKYQVDKGCFEISEDKSNDFHPRYMKPIGLHAPLVAPYAVFLR